MGPHAATLHFASFLATFTVNTPGPATSSDPPSGLGPAAQPADPPSSDPELHSSGHNGISTEEDQVRAAQQVQEARDRRLRAVFPETGVEVDVHLEIPVVCPACRERYPPCFEFPHMAREVLDVFSQRCTFLEEWLAPGDPGAAASRSKGGNYSIDVFAALCAQGDGLHSNLGGLYLGGPSLSGGHGGSLVGHRRTLTSRQ